MMSSDKIKQRINRLKNNGKTLALATLLSSPLTANAAQNNSTSSDYTLEGKTEVVTKHLNQKYSQTSTLQSRETFNHHDNSEKNYTSAFQSLYELGDGYFMTSLQVMKQETKNNHPSFFEDNKTLYLTTPTGETYDCSFLHQNKKFDFLPVGFEKNCFVKEDGQPDIELENKLVNKVKKLVGVNQITPEATMQYNNLIKDKKLVDARKKGMPEEVVAKIDIYLQQNLELLNSGKTYIASISSFRNMNAQAQKLSQIKGKER